MDPQTFGAVLLVGFAAGVLSGGFGVGGAVLTTPGIRVLGASPIHAVGSTVPALLPSAISGTLRYARAGLVDWRVGITSGASGAALAILGAWTADVVNAHWLMVLTATLLGWSGASVFRGARRDRPDSAAAALVDDALADEAAPAALLDAAVVTAVRTRVAADRAPTAMLVAVGAAAGFLAGLLGVGGGVILMPVFTGVLRIPVKTAVASSLVAVAIFSVPALVAHIVLDHIHWGFAAALVAGVVPGAQVGARLTIGANERTVRCAFGLFLMAISLVYGGGELASL